MIQPPGFGPQYRPNSVNAETLRHDGNRCTVRADVRLSAREDVGPLWQDVQAGIIRSVSVGYAVRACRSARGGRLSARYRPTSDGSGITTTRAVRACGRSDLLDRGADVEPEARRHRRRSLAATVAVTDGGDRSGAVIRLWLASRTPGGLQVG
jgi:hypothetical protein